VGVERTVHVLERPALTLITVGIQIKQRRRLKRGAWQPRVASAAEWKAGPEGAD
jgi:hypothetical protein